ncbi:MAG: CIA30 family protein [Chloroflexota bacterium]
MKILDVTLALTFLTTIVIANGLFESRKAATTLSLPINKPVPTPDPTVESVELASLSSKGDEVAQQVDPNHEATKSPLMTPTPDPTLILFNFIDGEPTWYTVNDDVMGGVSRSSVSVNSETAVLNFSGNVSLENNGGFASIRSRAKEYNLSAFDGITIRVRGDGNTYRFRIRTEKTGPDISYTSIFETEANMWQEVFIPFADMVPLYRGFVVRDAGLLDPATIRSFGLMMTDKQEGEFMLEVEQIIATYSTRN